MGHLGDLKAEYHDLARRLDGGVMGFPAPSDARAWDAWKEILEILYPPEDAELAARLPLRPATLEALSARLEMPADELRRRLEPMCERGIVMDLVHPRTGEVTYLLSPPLGGFVEFSMMRAHDGLPKKRLAEAFHAYCLGDETFAREVFTRDTVIGRAAVHETVLDDETPDVLDWERATAVIESARVRAVSLCYCRHSAQHLDQACSAPVDNCLSLNTGADFVIRRAFGREVSATEALEILARSREAGLVQIADNVKSRPIYICNCCGCCCHQLQAINRFGLDAVKPSGFVPRLQAASCKGCGRCARACPVAAISMAAGRVAGQRQARLQPRVDDDRCIGCGVCAGSCRRHALRMTRHARPYVPENGVERAVRMALERGHLADLFFEGGKSRGQRFLHRALRAVEQLEPVQRALASEQLRSRFIRFALGGR